MIAHSLNFHRRVIAISIFIATCSLVFVNEANAFEVTAAQRVACMPDAMRLCSSEIPDVGRVIACMRANHARVSATCRATFSTSTRSSKASFASR